MTQNMTYKETLERIHGFQKFGSKLGLERMNRLMELLGNPQDRMKVIHVAGTNGKGSVCRFLYTVLQENGYRAGLYTSPYLERFTERIEFNGSEISEAALIEYTQRALEKIDVMLSEGWESPTEFELVTAIAFLYFSEQEMDFLVLEAGLGGTGDSTNVRKRPLVSVITSISYDHMAQLGDTLSEIAENKAGIIKTGAPVVFNVDDASAAAAIRKTAAAKGSRVCEIKDVSRRILRQTLEETVFDAEALGAQYQNLAIGMLGAHQVGNALCSLAALEILRQENHVALDKDKIYAGFRKAKQTGRFEVTGKTPGVIIEGSHNEAGAAALKAAMAEYFPGKKVLMITGMLADKKVDNIIEKFAGIADEFIATEPDNPRKLPAAELQELIAACGFPCKAVPDPIAACEYATGLDSYDVLLVAGSLYLVGKVRAYLLEQGRTAG